jgi:RNA polymerase sigma-70 factor (ECF subfamily)
MIMTTLMGTQERIQSLPIVFQSARRKPQRPSDQAERLARLMRDAQNGDQTSYTLLLKEILPILKRLVQSRLGFLPVVDREDIVQEILLSLHAARATYDPKRPFMPWLRSIARNRMIDNARRNSRRLNNEVLVGEFPDHVADANAGEPASQYINAEALQQAIAGLPPGQRQALELLKFRTMSLKEASALSSLSTGALKVSVHRAIRTLRGSLNA